MSRSPMPGRRLSSRHAVAAVALAVGIGLAAFAWPRFVGGAVIAPYEDTLRTIARGTPPKLAELDTARDAAKVSLAWLTFGETMRRRGAFDLVRARLVKTPEAQKAALDASVRWLRAGLARAPAESYSWLQLAQALSADRGVTPAVNGPLRMSLRTDRWEHRLIVSRLDVAFRNWTALDADVRAAMTPQIRRAIDTAPRALVQITRRDFALRQVLDAVAGSPVHAARFRIVYFAPN